jgi:hypothetical protein
MFHLQCQQYLAASPPKHQTSLPFQHSAIHKHPTRNTICSEVQTPVASIWHYDISCWLGQQFCQWWLPWLVNKWEQVFLPSLIHAQLCHPHQFPDLLVFHYNLFINCILTIFIFILTLNTTVNEWKLFVISNVVHFQFSLSTLLGISKSGCLQP